MAARSAKNPAACTGNVLGSKPRSAGFSATRRNAASATAAIAGIAPTMRRSMARKRSAYCESKRKRLAASGRISNAATGQWRAAKNPWWISAAVRIATGHSRRRNASIMHATAATMNSSTDRAGGVKVEAVELADVIHDVAVAKVLKDVLMQTPSIRIGERGGEGKHRGQQVVAASCATKRVYKKDSSTQDRTAVHVGPRDRQGGQQPQKLPSRPMRFGNRQERQREEPSENMRTREPMNAGNREQQSGASGGGEKVRAEPQRQHRRSRDGQSDRQRREQFHTAQARGAIRCSERDVREPFPRHPGTSRAGE